VRGLLNQMMSNVKCWTPILMKCKIVLKYALKFNCKIKHTDYNDKTILLIGVHQINTISNGFSNIAYLNNTFFYYHYGYCVNNYVEYYESV